MADARERLYSAQREATPSVAEIDAATALVHQAERDASSARIRERLDRLSLEPPARSIERSIGIDSPGR